MLRSTGTQSDHSLTTSCGLSAMRLSVEAISLVCPAMRNTRGHHFKPDPREYEHDNKHEDTATCPDSAL